MKKFLVIILILSVFIGVFASPLIASAQETSGTAPGFLESLEDISAYTRAVPFFGLPIGVGKVVGQAAGQAAVSSVTSGAAGDVVSQVIGAILSFFMWIASWLLFVSAILFNLAINNALNFGGQGGLLQIVDFGWTLFRDISNIIFIFIILWIGISTILNLEGGSRKKLLVKVVIVALLINFSLFFTKVIVDISNTIAIGFYNEIITDAEELANQNPAAFDFSPAGRSDGIYSVGLSELIMAKLKLQTLYRQENIVGEDGESTGVRLVPVANIQEESNLVYFMGIIFILVATFVLAAGAVLFTVRTIVLLFLMILSPLAYIGSLLPSTAGHAKEWWDKLLGQAQFAPFFIILMFVSIRGLDALDTVNVGQGATAGGFGEAFTVADPSNLDVIFNFALVIGIMIGALVISKKLSVFGANAVVKGTKNFAGRAAGATSGFLGRQTLGRAGESIARSENSRFGQLLKEGATSDSRIIRGISGAGLRFADKTSQQSFDVRGSSSIPGKAQKGGFKKEFEEKVKREVAFTKGLGKKPQTEEEKEEIEEQKDEVERLKTSVRRLKDSEDREALKAEREKLKEESEKLTKLENPRQVKRAEIRSRPTIASQVRESVAPEALKETFKARPGRFGAESSKKIMKGLKTNWGGSLKEKIKKLAEDEKKDEDEDEKKEES